MHSLIRFISHWLYRVEAHSLHSPFIYDFYTKCISADYSIEDFNAWEEARNRLIHDERSIRITSLGAASKVDNTQHRRISKIAKKGLSNAKTSRLLYRVIKYFQHRHVVELGTSFGINALYLATNRNVKVASFEGCNETMKIARKTIDQAEVYNIELVEGNIDHTLKPYLQQNPAVDLAFIDANHRYLPTLDYIELLLKHQKDELVIVLDDIYWSKEMSYAWNELYQMSEFTLSIDLFTLGILIVKKDLAKQHYVLDF